MAHRLRRRSALVAWLTLSMFACGGGRPIPADYALIHATVIDGTGSAPKPGMTVVVKGDRLVEVARDETVALAPGTTTFDLTGEYIIPGLADMHAHNQENISPSLFVVNGVTTVREMSGAPYVLQWKEKIRAGELLGPRLVVGSPMIDGAPSLWENVPAPFVSVTDAAGARAAVSDAKRQGYDFVKVYSRLSRDAYAGLTDQARIEGMRFAGHCPDSVSLSEASAAGQASFEHLFGLLYATSSEEGALRARVDQIQLELGPFGGYNSWFHQVEPLEWDAAGTHSPEKAAALYQALVRDGSAQVPTLTTLRLLDLPADVAVADDERLKYFPVSVVEGWKAELEWIFLAGRTPEEDAQRRELFARRLALVGALHRAGVKVLAGTDAITPWVFHGFSLHDELGLLVEAGLTPMEALQAATLEPARFLGLEASAGTVEKGKAADLVILDANPLEAISNTKKIHAVVAQGKWISPERRDAVLKELEASAKDL